MQSVCVYQLPAYTKDHSLHNWAVVWSRIDRHKGNGMNQNRVFKAP